MTDYQRGRRDAISDVVLYTMQRADRHHLSLCRDLLLSLCRRFKKLVTVPPGQEYL